MNKYKLLLGFCVLLTMPGFAYAAKFSAAELQQLPNFCQDKKLSKNARYWRREVFGDNWVHMHHYCNGMLWYARSLSASPTAKGAKSRGYYLTQAISNYETSINNATARAKEPGGAFWPLLPDALHRLGQALDAKARYVGRKEIQRELRLDAQRAYQRAIAAQEFMSRK